MNEYTIQQRVTHYYEVTVFADSLDEAFTKAELRSDWERVDETITFEDEYYYKVNDTEWVKR